MDMRPTTVFLFAIVGACNLTNPFPDFRARALEETNNQEALWKAKNVHSYDFDFQRDCSGCSATAIQQVNIHVRDDVITRVVSITGADVAPQAGVSWPTVDSLFLWSRQFLDNTSFTVELDFDSTYHFPNFIRGQAPGFAAEHHTAGLVEQTSTAPIRVANGDEMPVTGYLIGEPFSKSNRVVWRNR